MNGIIEEGQPLTRTEFAARLKARYPEYTDISDEELVTIVLQEFPHYRRFIVGEPDYTVADLVGIGLHARQIEAARLALSLWLLPPIALVVTWLAGRWIYRGFRSPPAIP